MHLRGWLGWLCIALASAQWEADTRGDDEYALAATRAWKPADILAEFFDQDLDKEGEEALAHAPYAVQPKPDVDLATFQRALTNPTWALDRSKLRLSSVPVVEQGFWREVALNFERLRVLYGRHVVEVGNRVIPDRFIATKLKGLYRSGSCAATKYLSPWHQKILHSYVVLMLKVYPIKYYYLGGNQFRSADKGDVETFGQPYFAGSTVTFHEDLYKKRLKSRLAKERLLPFSLSKGTEFLRLHLDHLDMLRPYEKEVQLVSQLIRPGSHRGAGKNSRKWKSSSTTSYRRIMGAILSCLGEKTNKWL
eukprot:Gregarina_sp_Poly_1__896@NODE_1214_length_4765_cov_82_919327_g828_i0_p3_GENE_NODE_1214_length_4765_cov_82_919327_g828_i0NODE_1214_length_4765_cov_82_919327_g828_i0_p3_ORF_typecomplete_len307_score46_35_NODE_1214_length_4765_cov_82_919327_g828_i024573377